MTLMLLVAGLVLWAALALWIAAEPASVMRGTRRTWVGSGRKTSKGDWLADYRSIAELEAVTAD